MSQKRIVFVESSCVGAGYLAAAALELGHSPLFLTSPSFSQGDTRACIARHRFIECETSDVEAMAAVLTREVDPREVELITSFSDTCLGVAAQLARRLSVRGLGEVVEQLKDKGRVYEWVPEYSPPSVVFSAQSIPEEAIRELVRAHGPVMVKGRRSSGGLGAFVLRDASEVGGLQRLIAASPIPGHLAPELWLAQAFVDGRLVSLEGYVSGGRPVFLGFSGRKKVGMSESIIMFPWDEELPRPAMAHAREAVTALVERSGFDNAYFHVEFMLTEDRAFIIDANMGRIGGGGLGQQLAIAYGITPEEVHRHALALELAGGRSLEGPYRGAPRATSSIMYGVPVQATVQEVTLPEPFEGFHTRILDYNQVVPPMGQDNYAWIGITSGVRGRIESETAKIQIQTDKGRFSATF
jgi:hypothetical protein